MTTTDFLLRIQQLEERIEALEAPAGLNWGWTAAAFIGTVAATVYTGGLAVLPAAATSGVLGAVPTAIVENAEPISNLFSSDEDTRVANLLGSHTSLYSMEEMVRETIARLTDLNLLGAIGSTDPSYVVDNMVAATPLAGQRDYLLNAAEENEYSLLIDYFLTNRDAVRLMLADSDWQVLMTQLRILNNEGENLPNPPLPEGNTALRPVYTDETLSSGVYSGFETAIRNSPPEVAAAIMLGIRDLSRDDYANLGQFNWGETEGFTTERLIYLLDSPELLETVLSGMNVDPELAPSSRQAALVGNITENPSLIDDLTQSPIVSNILLELINSPTLRDLIVTEVGKQLLVTDESGTIAGELLTEINQLIDTKLRDAGLVPFTLNIGTTIISQGLTWLEHELGVNGDGNQPTPPQPVYKPVNGA